MSKLFFLDLYILKRRLLRNSLLFIYLYMLMKDKIIIVLYVGCKGMNVSDASHQVVRIRESFKTSFDESSQLFVLPNSDMNPMKFQLECLNPKYLTQEEQEKLSASLDKFLKNMNEYDTAGSEQK